MQRAACTGGAIKFARADLDTVLEEGASLTTDGGGVVGENNGDLALFGSLNEAIGNAAGKGVQVNQVGLFFVKDLTEMVRCLGVAPAIQFWKREGRRLTGSVWC